MGRSEQISTWKGITPEDPRFWLERGIDLDVRDARPYVPYGEDVSAVREAFAALRSPGQKASIVRKARAVGGVMIERHPVMPGLGDVLPELRPNVAISTETPRRHWHGYGEPPEDDRFYERLNPNSEPGKAHLRKHHTDPETGAIVNTEAVHGTTSPGKYHFAPNGKRDVVYVHDHALAYSGVDLKFHSKYITIPTKAERLARHLQAAHDGVDVMGAHEHTVRRPNPDDNLAKRLDVHPWAAARLEDAEEVFFGLEGCMKADAILSAILREDRKASVVSVPSVTLWDPAELEEFARQHLLGKRLVICPDADWIENSAVIEQARLCRTYLRRLGVTDTYIAAPPLKDGEVEHKGVDDYLGAGGTLDELAVQHRTVDEGAIRYYLRGFFLRKDRLERDADMLHAIAAHADTEGRFYGTLARLSRVLGVGPRNVERAVRSLEGLGAITIDGSLEIRKEFWSRGWGWSSGENPVITLRSDLRGRDSTFPLREVSF